MNDEIKKILDKIKRWCDLALDDKCNTIMYKYEFVAILDYITNLQQEIKIKDTNWESLKYYLQRLFDKDYIEEEIFDDICKKANELESQIEIKGYQKDIEQLQQKENIIKEVREYIRKNSIYYPTSDGCQWVDQFKVLEILDKVEENK